MLGGLTESRWARYAPWAIAAVTAVFSAVGLGMLIASPWAGLDLTDESLYLLAADNHQPGAAFNGWFGRYTGSLYGAVGYDIGSFRLVGVAIVLLASAMLAVAAIRLLDLNGAGPLDGPRRTILFAGICGGGLLDYHLFIRSPGYNWLTFVGATLAAAGIVWLLGPSPQHVGGAAAERRAFIVPGLLVAIGCFTASAGKVSAGLALALLAAVVILFPWIDSHGRRLQAGLVAIAAFVLLSIAHAVFVSDPVATVRVLQRSLTMLEALDPRYQPGVALSQALHDLAVSPRDVARLTSGLALLGLSPLVALRVRPQHRQGLAAGLGAGSIVLVAALLLVRGDWVGGVPGYPLIGRADLAILATASLAALSAGLVLLRRAAAERLRRAIRLALAAFSLAAAALAYAFGSDNGVLTQSSGAAGLVLLATALLVAAPVARPIAARVVIVVPVLMAVLSALVIGTARSDPYRMLPVATASETIAFGPHGQSIVVDPASAAYWQALRSAAASAGWAPGTRLLDLTWTPAVPYDLGATVPETLVPMVGRYETANASAVQALRLSDPASWSDAWLLTSPGITQVSPSSIVTVVGRSFPADYTLVGTFVAPGLGLHQELWRPRG